MNVGHGEGQTRRWGIAAWAVVLGGLCGSVPSVAQPMPIPPALPRPGSGGGGGQATPTVQVEPSTVLDEMRKALQDAWAERVTITVKTGERTTRQGEYVLRSAPSASGEAAGEVRGRRVLIELGTLRCVVEGGEVVVHSARHPSTYFQASIKGEASAEALGSVLPMVLLPTLELARDGGGEGAMDLTPLTREVRWLSAEGNPNAVAPDRAMWTLQGMSAQGPVMMVVDAQTSRVQRLVIPVSEKAPDRPGIEMVFTPMSPGEPATWKPDVSKRRRVESIAQLSMAQPALGAGQVLTLPRMMSLAGAAAERGVVFTAAPNTPTAADGPAVVLLIVNDARTNDTKPAPTDALIAQAEMVMAKLRAEMKPTEKPPGYVRLLCVNELPDAGGLEAFRSRVRSRWPALAGVPDAGVLIGGPSEELIRAMTPEMLPALVIARADGVVRAVVPLEGYFNAPEQLLSEVKQGLGPREEIRSKPE
ncbi:MAG: hypothetical protein IBJ18_12150 [Phycisphaerales bacterium]|nr:hypothetical protein [Phycisphaerales bacterium]